jgi:hypothetical protein
MTYYSDHKEEMKAYQQDYYRKNIEMCRAYNAAYYQGVTKPAREKLRQRMAMIAPPIVKKVRFDPKAKRPKKVKPNIQIEKPPVAPRVTMREGILFDWHA